MITCPIQRRTVSDVCMCGESDKVNIWISFYDILGKITKN